MAKRKRKSIAGLLEDAANILQRIRRIEESEDGYCTCVSCGKIGHWKEMQGGHWIPRTKTATKIEPTNIHPQCHSCNHFRKEEAAPLYALYMQERYGIKHCEMLVEMSKQTTKWSRVYLEEKITEFKVRLKELEDT